MASSQCLRFEAQLPGAHGPVHVMRCQRVTVKETCALPLMSSATPNKLLQCGKTDKLFKQSLPLGSPVPHLPRPLSASLPFSGLPSQNLSHGTSPLRQEGSSKRGEWIDTRRGTLASLVRKQAGCVNVTTDFSDAGTRSSTAAVGTAVDWGREAFRGMLWHSAVFLPYALVFAFGFKPAIRWLTPGAWDRRFTPQLFDHLRLWQFHASAGVLYTLASPLQFLPNLRRNNITLHRASGYISLTCAGVLMATGLLMAPQSELPNFVAPSIVNAAIWAFCASVALWKVKQKRIAEHRVWMIRAGAAGFVGPLTRPMHVIVKILSGFTLSFTNSAAPGYWLAMLVMMVGAELYIRKRLEV